MHIHNCLCWLLVVLTLSSILFLCWLLMVLTLSSKLFLYWLLIVLTLSSKLFLCWLLIVVTLSSLLVARFQVVHIVTRTVYSFGLSWHKVFISFTQITNSHVRVCDTCGDCSQTQIHMVIALKRISTVLFFVFSDSMSSALAV